MKHSRFNAPAGLRSSTALLTVFAAVVLAAPAGALGPGDPAPQFSAPALAGNGKLSLSSYRGKIVYVDFWASWCGPCLTSLPLIEELRKEFPQSDFQVIAVNLDRDADKARKFLARKSVGYPSVTDPKGLLPKQFGLETMPSSYLIDRRGVVRYVHEGFRRGDIEGLRARIAKLVAAPR